MISPRLLYIMIKRNESAHDSCLGARFLNDAGSVKARKTDCNLHVQNSFERERDKIPDDEPLQNLVSCLTAQEEYDTNAGERAQTPLRGCRSLDRSRLRLPYTYLGVACFSRLWECLDRNMAMVNTPKDVPGFPKVAMRTLALKKDRCMWRLVTNCWRRHGGHLEKGHKRQNSRQ